MKTVLGFAAVVLLFSFSASAKTSGTSDHFVGTSLEDSTPDVDDTFIPKAPAAHAPRAEQPKRVITVPARSVIPAPYQETKVVSAPPAARVVTDSVRHFKRINQFGRVELIDQPMHCVTVGNQPQECTPLGNPSDWYPAVRERHAPVLYPPLYLAAEYHRSRDFYPPPFPRYHPRGGFHRGGWHRVPYRH